MCPAIKRRAHFAPVLRLAPLLLLVVNNYVSGAPTVPNAAWDQAAKSIAEESSYAYREFTRDVYTYHWGDKKLFAAEQTDSAVPLYDDRGGAGYAKMRSLWTYQSERPSNGVLGQSLYVAADPWTTRGYGDGLLEIRLPSGARYLDLRSIRTFPPDVQQKVIAAGCHASQLDHMLISPADDPCHRLIERVLQILHISAVAYDYDMASKPRCPSYPGAAFIVVNPSLGDPKYSHTFVPREPPPRDSGNDDRARIRDLAKMFAYFPEDVKFWPELAPPKIDIEEWMHEHIFGCDTSKHPEDQKSARLDHRPLPPLDFKAGPAVLGYSPPIVVDSQCPADGMSETEYQLKRRAAQVNAVVMQVR